MVNRGMINPLVEHFDERAMVGVSLTGRVTARCDEKFPSGTILALHG
jgi:hypothetical protein